MSLSQTEAVAVAATRESELDGQASLPAELHTPPPSVTDGAYLNADISDSQSIELQPVTALPPTLSAQLNVSGPPLASQYSMVLSRRASTGRERGGTTAVQKLFANHVRLPPEISVVLSLRPCVMMNSLHI